jgi:hypothetical protein
MGIYIPPSVRVDSVAKNGETLVDFYSGNCTPGQVAYVSTLRWPFRLLESNLSTDNLNVVNAVGLPGYQWIRIVEPNPFWQSYMKWSVSWASGDDENDGSTDAAPLKTWTELSRRINGATYVGLPEIRLLDSSPVSDIFTPNVSVVQPGTFFGFLWITGVPTQVYKGAISATNFVGNANFPTTASNTITDAGANFPALAVPGNIATRTNGSISYFHLIDGGLGGNQCHISVPTDVNPTAGNFGGFDQAPLAPGDTYIVYKLPDMPDIQRQDNNENTNNRLCADQ